MDIVTKAIISAVILAATCGGALQATTIAGAVSATATGELRSTCGIGNGIDQSALSIRYSSGVTDSDQYPAQDPTHWFFAPDEWFSQNSVTSATLTLDLGSVLSIDRVALWHEEAVGFGNAIVNTPTDGNLYSWLTTLNFQKNPDNFVYGARVFDFAIIGARFFQIDGTDRPRGAAQYGQFRAMGEIAFSQTHIPAVPVPASGLLLLGGIGGLAAARRRKAG